MKILTCNIRYAGATDGDNGWPRRRDLCAEVIRSRTPEIIDDAADGRYPSDHYFVGANVEVAAR